MKIIPLRGLSLDNVHAPGGVPVECRDDLARELIALGVADRAPIAPEKTPPPAPLVETALAAPAPEAAIMPSPSPRLRPSKLRRGA